MFWPTVTPEGGRVIKTTMGLSVLYSPFFAIAHSVAYLYGYPMNGFSYPYQKYIHLSGLFYFIIGLFYLRKFLLLYYSELVTTITLVVATIGTQLLYYTTTDSAGPHPYTFALTTFFFWNGIKWFNDPSLKQAVVLGLIAGLMVLIRPVNILFGLFFILFRINSMELLKNRFSFFIQNIKPVLLIAICAFLVQVPQLLYWKYVTGHYFFNSYVGERFYFDNPHILEGLFSYRKGWLVYTPVMIFSLLGFVFIKKKCPDFAWLLWLFIPVYMYVIFSWWCWWYGGGFGMRAMIDTYALLSFSLAAFIAAVVESRRIIIKITSFAMILVLTCYNIFEVLQYRSGSIHWDSMCRRVFWKSFCRIPKPENFNQLICPPQYEKARLAQGEEYEFSLFK